MNKQLDLNSISRSIAYGNIAFWLGKKADQSQSYRWICFVRGIYNEDISYFVKEVVFTLHPSFPNHIRVVNSFPFEILEHGWGEFDINIKIYFKEEYQKPVELFHLLKVNYCLDLFYIAKLHPSVPNVITTQKKPLISEFYDEIVFLNPSRQFAEVIYNFDKLQNEVKLQMEQEKEQQALLQQEQQLEQPEKQQEIEMNEQEHKESENQMQNEIIKEDQDQQISSEQGEQPQSQQQQQQRANIESQSNDQITSPENNYQQYLSEFPTLIPIHQQQLEDALSYVNFELKQLQDKIIRNDDDIMKMTLDWEKFSGQLNK